MSPLVQRFLRSLLALWFVAAAGLAAADDFRIESRQGTIESIDINANQLVVAGVRYDVAIDADIEIGGSYGAFTLLHPGMNVQVLVRRSVETGQGQLIEVKELPPGVAPEQY